MTERDQTHGSLQLEGQEPPEPEQQILPLGHDFEDKVPRPNLEQLELLG